MACPNGSRARPRVLFVDDNHTQLDLYAFVLRDEYDVWTATRGETGYSVACAERPDAMVVDVLLPDLDGLDLCRRLLSNAVTASIPLIVLTGDDAAYARARVVRGLDAVLKKPCPAEQLLGALRRTIGARATG